MDFIGNNWALFIVFLLLANLFAIYRINRRLPSAYRIAVIGFPKAGKTFLITSIFRDLFLGKIPGFKTIPRGRESIERINKYIKLIESGEAIGPTTDQDVFAFRADLVQKSYPLQQKRWKAEIGDFPGEDTEDFIKENGEWLHNSNYFKWAISADAVIFNIDLADYLTAIEPEKFAIQMKTSFQAAWMHIEEYHIDGHKNLQRMPVSLVFTKADLLIRYSQFQRNHSKSSQEFINEIKEYGFQKIHWLDLRGDQDIEIDQQIFIETINDFSDIVKFFQEKTNKFNIEFVSAITKTHEGSYGIKSLLSNILPH